MVLTNGGSLLRSELPLHTADGNRASPCCKDRMTVSLACAAGSGRKRSSPASLWTGMKRNGHGWLTYCS